MLLKIKVRNVLLQIFQVLGKARTEENRKVLRRWYYAEDSRRKYG